MSTHTVSGEGLTALRKRAAMPGYDPDHVPVGVVHLHAGVVARSHLAHGLDPVLPVVRVSEDLAEVPRFVARPPLDAPQPERAWRRRDARSPRRTETHHTNHSR